MAKATKDTKQEARNELRARLTSIATPVIADANHPHILLEAPCKFVIIQHDLVQVEKKTLHSVIDDILDVDEDLAQEYLQGIATYHESYKAMLWRDIVPLVIGGQLAEGEVGEELNLVTNGQASLDVSYRRAINDVAYIKTLIFLAKASGLPSHYVRSLVRGRINEQISKANARRADARSGNGDAGITRG